jgi:hypothetical protein
VRPVAAAALVLALALSGGAWAADDPVFRIEFDDGKIAPQRLEVPAKTRFKIELINKGKTPIEFESTSLRKEKVVAPESQSFIVIRTLDPGEYEFFDDFHLDTPPAVLIAK